MKQFINKLLGRGNAKAEKETAVLEPEPAAEVTKGMSIVEQIHNEAFSAQELLLKEVHRILNIEIPDNDKKCARMEKLAKLGFKNAKQVKEFEEVIQKKKAYTEIKNLLDYYEREYPINRFINEGAVNRICKKYDLYLVQAEKYEAEIPEKNQKDIVNFRIKGQDVRWPTEIWKDGERSKLSRNGYSHYNTGTCRDAEGKIIREEGKYLLIVAPEHKINTEGLTKRGRTIVNEDPIVLQPVLGGYLIVTAWGLEAGDEEVVNKISN